MNIVCIPYHDWRKIETEGFRTRDSHIISHLAGNKAVNNLIIVNRPITIFELLIKKKNKKISGEKVFSYKSGALYKIKNNMYVFDFFSGDFLGPVLNGKKWFFNSFENKEFIEAYNKAMAFLGITVDVVYNQNIFASLFVKKLSLPSVFDAWDNFILFPQNKKFEGLFFNAYAELAKHAEVWTTNSVKNIDYYKKHYKPKECVLIKNGVDIERFAKKYPVPSDLKNIPSPIIGFGGKITHLFNYDFFNYAVTQHPDKSFVIVGQILDKSVFKQINKAKNVYYLGDKPYDQYVSYITNFNLGIIPYVTDHLEHGADSIKMYEYLASGLNVVGTSGAGMADMSSLIYISTNKQDFSDNINNALKQNKDIKLPEFHSWEYKTTETLDVLTKVISKNK